MCAMSAKREFFGTDGIRGVAGHHPLTAGFTVNLGVALAELLGRPSSGARFLIGMDTRRSGPMLAKAITAGLTSRGADVVLLGVVPTPAVAYLTRELGVTAGIMISASHNPYQDNGIKIFNSNGEKLSDEVEAGIEQFILGGSELADVTHADIGVATADTDDTELYFRFLLDNAPFLDGLKVGLDCANGAASELAPRVFKQIGARLDVLCAQPDGVNINDGSGSTHPQLLQQRMKEHDLDVGVTFDGDADRTQLIDRQGRLVTGDHMLAILALARGEQEVVATVMSNLGLERFLADNDVKLHRTAVGDRYVSEELRQRNLKLGGEQSGHLLMLDRAPTGDGILSALQVLSAVRASNMSLEEWMDRIPVYPQLLTNITVPAGSKHAIAEHPDLLAAVADVEKRLGDDGRVNVRPSGTEALVRIMIEGPDTETVESLSNELAETVQAASRAEVA